MQMLVRLRERNKAREHTYEPRGNIARLQTNDAPQIVLSGPAGTGKSRGCLEKLRSCSERWPGVRSLIVRKTRTSLTETGLLTFERDVMGFDHPMIVNGPQRTYRQKYRFDNGSEIVTGGLDRIGRILSGEFDLIFVQQAEEAVEDDWEILDTRLRNNRMPYQQLMGDVNPQGPNHWLKRRCDAAQSLMWETRHEDNPLLWRINEDGSGEWTEQGKAYITRLDALTGARKARLRYGRWVQAEGVVYETYDPAVHLIDRFDIPADWRRFRVVDFGYVNAFVCQWWAVDGDGRMYRYREIYMTGRRVAVHAKQINALSQGERIQTTVCDHDAENMATLREHGIKTRAADKQVQLGIEKVAARLVKQGDGKPRVFFLRDSLIETDQQLVETKKPYCTEQEWDGYVWANKINKEEPVKENDHGMDATRYAVLYLDGKRKFMIGFA